MKKCHGNIIADSFNYTIYNVIIEAHKGIKDNNDFTTSQKNEGKNWDQPKTTR